MGSPAVRIARKRPCLQKCTSSLGHRVWATLNRHPQPYTLGFSFWHVGLTTWGMMFAFSVTISGARVLDVKPRAGDTKLLDSVRRLA